MLDRRVFRTDNYFYHLKPYKLLLSFRRKLFFIYFFFNYLKTLQITSSILTTISFFFFGVYCLLWINQPEYEWMPPFYFACIIFFSWMGQIPIPFIITIEIFPKKVNITNQLQILFSFKIFGFLDSTNMPCVSYINDVGDIFRHGLCIPCSIGNIWSI